MLNSNIYTFIHKTQLGGRLATWLGTKTNFFVQKKKKRLAFDGAKINSQTFRTQETKDLHSDCE